MKDDYPTNSHYVSPIHFSLEGWENVLFELRSERVNQTANSEVVPAGFTAAPVARPPRAAPRPAVGAAPLVGDVLPRAVPVEGLAAEAPPPRVGGAVPRPPAPPRGAE